MIRVDASEQVRSFERLREKLKEGALRILDETAKNTAQWVKHTTKFKSRTGELLKSVRASRPSTFHRFVVAGAKHAGWVENGTRPHPIAAKNGKFLRFQQNGSWRYARRVMHPGTKPAHFMKEVADKMRPLFAQAMKRMIDAAVAGASW